MKSIEIFSFEEPGIKPVYNNKKWEINLKNWREKNDISGIWGLEVHYQTDKQFVLLAGKAVMIWSGEEPNKGGPLQATPIEAGKLYNIPSGLWFNNVLSKDGKLLFVVADGTVLAPDNSVYQELNEQQIAQAQDAVRPYL